MKFGCWIIGLLVAGVVHAGMATYTVGDPVGDWGAPSLYGMYPRGPGYIRLSLAFDTLLWKAKDEIGPALAERWTVDKTGTTYTFTIRSGVKWHDNVPFTADDVVFTYEYLKKHPSAWFNVDLVAECSATGREVRILLSKSNAPFIPNMAASMPILPKHIWQDVADPRRLQTPKAYIGTGPYRVADYSKVHGTYLFEAFTGYYGGKPRFDRIRFIKLPAATTPAALTNGTVNAASILAESIDSLKTAGLQIIAEPPTWLAKLAINHRAAPFDDVRVRQAIACAIDYDKLVRIGCRGHAIVGSPGMIPPANKFWHNPRISAPKRDLAHTAQLLKASGLDPGTKPIELLVKENSARIGELLKADLTEAGFKIQLRSMSPKSADMRILHWKFQLAVTGHGGLGGDPDILRRVIAGPGFNSARYTAKAELADLLQQQVKTVDFTARRKLVFRVQELYARELPAIPLFHKRGYWSHNGAAPLFYTDGGVAIGIPIPLNKSSFVIQK